MDKTISEFSKAILRSIAIKEKTDVNGAIRLLTELYMRNINRIQDVEINNYPTGGCDEVVE